jgi:hypothetical protein
MAVAGKNKVVIAEVGNLGVEDLPQGFLELVAGCHCPSLRNAP